MKKQEINTQDLKTFLVKAKKATYAAGDDANKTTNKDKSTTINYTEGNYEYHDNYFGGEPYGGREVVFYKGNPIYIMTYYGSVNESTKDTTKLFETLLGALTNIPEDNPYRGPEIYTNESMQYRNVYSGDITDFSGEEEIIKDQQTIYKAKYMGGLVDIRK